MGADSAAADASSAGLGPGLSTAAWVSGSSPARAALPGAKLSTFQGPDPAAGTGNAAAGPGLSRIPAATPDGAATTSASAGHATAASAPGSADDAPAGPAALCAAAAIWAATASTSIRGTATDGAPGTRPPRGAAQLLGSANGDSEEAGPCLPAARPTGGAGTRTSQAGAERRPRRAASQPCFPGASGPACSQWPGLERSHR